jgi:hypothetical protein
VAPPGVRLLESTSDTQYGPRFGADTAWSIGTDAAGNIYVAGSTNGDLDGNVNADPSREFATGSDIFLAKYDSAGVKQWTRQLGTEGSDSARAIATDANGTIYVVGTTSGALRANVSAGGSDIFLLKFDTLGNELWARQWGACVTCPAIKGGEEKASGVAIDAVGSVYVLGEADAVGDGLTSSDDMDALVLKYDASGTQLWMRKLGSPARDYATGIAAAPDGGVYVSGSTPGTIPGLTSAGGGDAFLAKLDDTGNTTWIRQFGSGASEGAIGVAVDSTGGVYLAGQLQEGDYHTLDTVLWKFDSAGVQQWKQRAGSPDRDETHALALDDAGNVHVTGQASGSYDGQFWNEGSASYDDVFLVSWDGAGNKLRSLEFGSRNHDRGFAVATARSGVVYVAGQTAARLDPQSRTSLNWDAFLVAIDPAGTWLWD